MTNIENKKSEALSRMITLGLHIGTMLALLYISDNVEEWASDMLDIQAKTPMAYVINYDAEWCSEFGSIGVANVCGQVVRK